MLLDPLIIRGLELPNRVMMAPMSQRAADTAGRAGDWHMVHYGSRAIGGVGLVMLEDSAVAPAGRGHSRALGLYDDEQAEALSRIVEFCHTQGTKVGVQLGHAGRKAYADESEPLVPVVGATGKPFSPDGHVPRKLSDEQIRVLVRDFAAAAERARRVGVDVIEIHAAHGYLIHEFLSPLTNTRSGPFGGNPAGRSRFLHEVVEAVRAACGADMPMFVRLAVEDLAPNGWTLDDSAVVINQLGEAGCDLIAPIAGGAVMGSSMFEHPVDFLGLASDVRARTGMATAASGGIADAASATRALTESRCDIVAIGRLLLHNPFWVASLGEDTEG
ncbi:oxidoreductase [Mycobacterium saskatchewanense]|uniref:NADH:flavin oxidoreductase/NADH oxidase N-terminal domain-containing protein n=1 Tax=Mycobacterium saskatchewanense TaxID=220927 RepID=A0AAJ3NK73_9MYCO|nr:oxidoreductase [Mycobacterium saskatchewanense]ORW64091.1 hypothetical protein AWC23_25900 [Mycobacterium saskatchewanense]BBX62227.1 oxidoreductase [Mycobacterium saskatchewanense]